MNGLGGRLLIRSCRRALRTTVRPFDNAARRAQYRLCSVKENSEESPAPLKPNNPSNLPSQYVPKELFAKDVSRLAQECMQLL